MYLYYTLEYYSRVENLIFQTHDEFYFSKKHYFGKGGHNSKILMNVKDKRSTKFGMRG